ncbi:hypothetical protein DSM112329_04375 [Paraconexibacter sp. AEG42_29]|uniref:Pyrroline-5-carboxylate reductase catalytic N-terminal domain-containing protein n=1 Tax=Paraconexibacter sp. AEG42_29 TaxID=2997339 RepID=A0AAU7B1J1_9ACTN
MRHRIALVGSSECTRNVALLLLLRDDCHVQLSREDAGGLKAAAGALGVEPRVEGPVPIAALTAAPIVIVCDGERVPVAELAKRCPDALLIVATSDPLTDAAALQEALSWPRQRVIGLDATAAAGSPAERAAGAVRLVDHVLADRGRVLEATVQVTALGGPESWASVPARIGAVGLQAIDAPPVRATAAVG